MSLHVGDTAPRLTLTCTSDGVAANLTGATVVLHFKKPDRTTATLAATVDSPTTAGKVTGAAWGSLLSVSGSWGVEVEVTYSDGTIQTFGPKSFYVSPQIA